MSTTLPKLAMRFAPDPEAARENAKSLTKRLHQSEFKKWQLLKMDEQERALYGEKRRLEFIAQHEENLQRILERNAETEALKKQVEDWVPPTQAHIWIKDRMLAHLVDSIEKEGNFAEMVRQAKELTPIQFYEGELKNLEEQIGHETKEKALWEEQIEVRTRWVDELRKSL